MLSDHEKNVGLETKDVFDSSLAAYADYLKDIEAKDLKSLHTNLSTLQEQ